MELTDEFVEKERSKWIYTQVVVKSPGKNDFSIIRQLIRHGCQELKYLPFYQDMNSGSLTIKEAKDLIYDTSGVSFIQKLYKNYPKLDILFDQIRHDNCEAFDPIYKDLLIFKLQIDQGGISASITLSCSDGILECNILSNKQEISNYGNN